MGFSLTYTPEGGSLTTIELPPDTKWTDEFTWSPVRQTTAVSLAGNLIVQQGTQTEGRPITLASGEDYAWARRSLIKQLYALMTSTTTVTVTTPDNRTFTAIFRHAETALEATPVFPYPVEDDSNYYHFTIRLMTRTV